MEKKVNIAELLKGAPKGIKLYSPVCGECTLVNVDCDEVFYPIHVCSNTYKELTFTKYGEFLVNEVTGECLLFPSKNCHTWENFKASLLHKQFEAGEKVLVKTDFFDVCKVEVWCLDLYSHYDERHDTHCLIGGSWCSDDRILPYKGNESLLGKEVE